MTENINDIEILQIPTNVSDNQQVVHREDTSGNYQTDILRKDSSKPLIEEPTTGQDSQQSSSLTTSDDDENYENASPLPPPPPTRAPSHSIGSIPPAYQRVMFDRTSGSDDKIFTTSLSGDALATGSQHQPRRRSPSSSSRVHHHHHTRSPLAGPRGSHLARDATSVSMFKPSNRHSLDTVSSFGSIFSDTRLLHGNHYPKNAKYVNFLCH